jgi:hypothetical protein
MRAILNFVFLIACIVISVAIGEHHGYMKAEAKMLKVNPPSEALEMACLGLWVGEQNKRYAEKSK